MLDVHPPHEAAHTWKDFFIHIATIVVGLLIAVGLEQTVESLHNAHLRNELREQLRRESRDNSVPIREDGRIAEAYIDWAQEQRQAVAAAGPVAPFLLPRLPAGIFLFPDTGAWLAAKDNGRTALLLREEQVWYSDLFRSEQRSFAQGTGAHDKLLAALSELDKTVAPLLINSEPDGIRMMALNREQVSSVTRALLSVQDAARNLDRELLAYDTANNFVQFTPRGQWFDAVTDSEYVQNRRKAFADHPRSAYLFSAR